MPNRNIHLEFDRFLIQKNVLFPDANYDNVHKFVDAGVFSYGRNHRIVDIYHQEEGVRRWLNGKINVIPQERATDWLRCALGHFCLDDANSKLDERHYLEDVFDYAYKLMKQRRWTNAHFKRKRSLFSNFLK